MLVLAVMPIMPIYQLPQVSMETADMSSTSLRMSPHFLTLPQLSSELDVIIVRKERTDQSHRHFHVRRSVAHRALQWLVMYNKYYRPSSVY